MRGVLGLNVVDARGNVVDGNTDSLDKETKTVLLYIYTCIKWPFYRSFYRTLQAQDFFHLHCGYFCTCAGYK